MAGPAVDLRRGYFHGRSPCRLTHLLTQVVPYTHPLPHLGAMDVLTIHGTPPPDAQSLRTFAYSATTIVLLLSTSTLALRLFARVKLQNGLELDDFLMIAGYVVSLDPAISLYISQSPACSHSAVAPMAWNTSLPGLQCSHTAWDTINGT